MRWILAIALCTCLSACGPISITQGAMSDDELKALFSKHRAGESTAYAVIKESLGTSSYLLTIHGYPDNGHVCRDLVAPYNSGASGSAIAGTYRCEPLR